VVDEFIVLLDLQVDKKEKVMFAVSSALVPQATLLAILSLK